QARREHSALSARPRGRAPQEGGEEGREEWPATLSLLGWRDQIKGAGFREQSIEIECMRPGGRRGRDALVGPKRKGGASGRHNRASLTIRCDGEGDQQLSRGRILDHGGESDVLRA